MANIVCAAQRAPDDVDVSAVITGGAENAQQSAPDEPLPGERYILRVDALRQAAKALSEERRETEELGFLGAFAAAGA